MLCMDLVLPNSQPAAHLHKLQMTMFSTPDQWCKIIVVFCIHISSVGDEFLNKIKK